MRTRPNNNFPGKVIISLALFICNVFSYGQDTVLLEAEKVFNNSQTLITQKKEDKACSLLEENIKLFEDSNSNLDVIYSWLGVYYFNNNNFEKAIIYHLKYFQLDMYKEDFPDYKVSILFYDLNNSRISYFQKSAYKEAVEIVKLMIKLLKLYPTYIDNYKRQTANLHSTLVWYYLLIKDFSLAEETCQNAEKYIATNSTVMSYKAHSILLQEKIPEAKKIYIDLGLDIDDGKENVKRILNEFNYLDSAGLITDNIKSDFEKIKSDLIAIQNNTSQFSDKPAVTGTIEDRTLIFRGNGEMEDFFYEKPSWNLYRLKIEHIVISEGVTSIGAYAFEELENLQSISLPKTLTKIGEGAFSGCKKIVDIKIPDNVISIEKDAFKDCKNLRSINIPEGVTSIEASTFISCEKLNVINNPGNLKSIGESAFLGCKAITSINIPKGVINIGDNAFIGCEKLRELTIPSSVKSIGNNAFFLTGLQFISVEDGNERYFSVNDRALCSYDTLLFVLGDEGFTIPEGITTIGEKAFIHIKGFKECEIASVTIPESVTKIEKFAFYNCVNLKTIKLPPNLVTIDSFAFELCTQLESVIIPKSVKIIGGSAFKYAGIRSIEFSGSDIQIGENCFWDCNNLESIVFNEKSKYNYRDGLLSVADTFIFCVRNKEGSVIIPENIKYIAESAFQGCEYITSVSIPDGVTLINNYAFADCISLTSVVIPNSVKHIGAYAFQKCVSLKSVILPDNLTEIKACTFTGCYLLSSINFPNSLKVIEKYAFNNTNLTSIVFPDSLVRIDNHAFNSCEKLTSVTFPESINNISVEAFDKCPELKAIVNLSPVPPNIDRDAFGTLIKDSIDVNKIVLFVAESSIPSYQNTDVWENFIIQPFSNNTEMLIAEINKVEEINLARTLLLQGKYDSAINIYKSLSTKTYIKKQTYCRLILEQLEELNRAGLLNNKMLSNIKKTREEIANLYEIEKIVIEARRLFKNLNYNECINILTPLQKSFTEESPFSSEALLLLGTSNYLYAKRSSAGTLNFFQARTCFQTLKKILENTGKKYSKEYFTVLYFLGSLYSEQFFYNPYYDDNIDFYLQAKELGEKIWGHEDKFDLMMNEYDSFGKSVGYLRNAISIEDVLSTNISISDKIINLYSKKGDYENLLQSYLNKINSVDKNSDDYLRYLNFIGEIYSNSDDNFNAENYFFEIISIFEKRNETQDERFAVCLMNLGKLYYNIGDYEIAEEYLINARNIFSSNNTLNSHSSIFSLIASVYKEQNKIKEEKDTYNEAEPYLLLNNEISKKTRHANPDSYASTLTSLGNLYYDMNEYKKAEDCYLEVNDIYLKTKDEYHPDYSANLSILGNLYLSMGDYSKAEKKYLKTIDIRSFTFDEKLPDNTTMNNLSILYQKNDDFEKAIEIGPDIYEQTITHINNNFSFLSENQRNKYWAKVEGFFENSFSLSYHHPSKDANEFNYNNTLFTKGLLLRTNNQIRDAIYDSGDESLIQQFEQLGSFRKQVNALQNINSSDSIIIKNLTNRADSLDKVLTQASAKFRELKEDMAITHNDVSKNLPVNAVAIEFVHFRLYDKEWTDSTIYAALILYSGMKSMKWIPLCNQNELQSILNTEGSNTMEKTETLYIDKGKELYQLIWKKIEKELSDIKTIYYSPSGLLHKIAFNALLTDNENILLADKYDMHLVSSTREIKRKDISTVTIQDTTTVYGSLLYDSQQMAKLVAKKAELAAAEKAALAAAAKPANQSSSDYSGAKKYRRTEERELPDVDLRSAFSKWELLPGSITETEKIVKVLENKQIPYQYYFESNGNEESFKNLNGKKVDVIHLSTHGFFLPDVERNDVEDIIRHLGGNKAKIHENSLLRSGLIMSGANEQWLAKESIMEDDIEDGILTAEEISRLNLTKTKLVVMSACETGLGDVKNSEGVFGLQRAFKLAGVESLIMSLWKVPDNATSELMSAFYEEWLGGKTRHESLKIAQKKVREKYKSPYFWAAFVMMD